MNNMIKKICVLVLVSLICIGLYALYSDGYLIGNYSYIIADDNVLIKTIPLAQKMHEAGYNSTVCAIRTGSTDSQIYDLINTLNTDSLDAILIDQAWKESSNPSEQKYGTEALTISNNWRFEAEYSDLEYVNENDENVNKFFYISPEESRIGASLMSPLSLKNTMIIGLS